MFSNPLLLLVVAPIAAGIVCLALPDALKAVARSLSFAVTLASLAGSVLVLMRKPLYWYYGDHRIFTADGLSAFVGIGIGLFAFLVAIYSFGYVKRPIGKYFGYILITLGSSYGAAFANNLLVLLTFWGALGITLYLLVNIEGTDKASAAAKKALIIIGGTDAVMLLGIAIIWQITGTFSMEKINLFLDGPAAIAAFLCLAVAAFAKAGVMPFHSWLPDVAEYGPTPVAAYLPASLDKLLGIYLLARVAFHMFVMNAASNLLLLAVGAITIVLAVVIALVQHDAKRLLGYHAVSQVGYMVLGIGTGTAIGMAGGIFHMFNNAIYKTCLFLSAGNVENKTGTTDLAKLGGLSRYMPVTFACFMVASLSISGVPPFNGFVSKWMIYQGIIESAGATNPAWMLWLACAMFGSALTLASFMKLLHAIFLGRAPEGFKGVREACISMSSPLIVLAGLCLIFGVFAFKLPIPLLIAPAINGVIVYLGVWGSVIASVLIVAGIAVGLLVYFFSRHGGIRTVETFVGGERADGLGRISGAEFYDTIKEMKGFKALYNKEEAKSFDIYELGSRWTFGFSGFLQWLHNGILPTYLVWCLIGMLGLFYLLMR